VPVGDRVDQVRSIEGDERFGDGGLGIGDHASKLTFAGAAGAAGWRCRSA
jgi:hypothetical protein